MKNSTFQTLLLIILLVRIGFDYFILNSNARAIIFLSIMLIAVVFAICNETFKED